MSYTIEYRYNYWTEGCGCCSNSSSEYSVWDDETRDCLIWEHHCELIESEEELREKFSAEYGDFNISADTHYF